MSWQCKLECIWLYKSRIAIACLGPGAVLEEANDFWRWLLRHASVIRVAARPLALVSSTAPRSEPSANWGCKSADTLAVAGVEGERGCLPFLGTPVRCAITSCLQSPLRVWSGCPYALCLLHPGHFHIFGSTSGHLHSSLLQYAWDRTWIVCPDNQGTYAMLHLQRHLNVRKCQYLRLGKLRECQEKMSANARWAKWFHHKFFWLVPKATSHMPWLCHRQGSREGDDHRIGNWQKVLKVLHGLPRTLFCFWLASCSVTVPTCSGVWWCTVQLANSIQCSKDTLHAASCPLHALAEKSVGFVLGAMPARHKIGSGLAPVFQTCWGLSENSCLRENRRLDTVET